MYWLVWRYAAALQLTEKSDVYSFGVVLLEVITGRPPILQCPEPTNIIQWVRQHLARGNIEDVADVRIQGEYDINSVWKVADVALKCTAQAPTQRPTMTDVVAQLQECLKLEEQHMIWGGGVKRIVVRVMSYDADFAVQLIYILSIYMEYSVSWF